MSDAEEIYVVPVPLRSTEMHPGWYHVEGSWNRAGQEVNMIFGPYDSPEEAADDARKWGTPDGKVFQVSAVYDPKRIR